MHLINLLLLGVKFEFPLVRRHLLLDNLQFGDDLQSLLAVNFHRLQLFKLRDFGLDDLDGFLARVRTYSVIVLLLVVTVQLCLLLVHFLVREVVLHVLLVLFVQQVLAKEALVLLERLLGLLLLVVDGAKFLLGLQQILQGLDQAWRWVRFELLKQAVQDFQGVLDRG